MVRPEVFHRLRGAGAADRASLVVAAEDGATPVPRPVTEGAERMRAETAAPMMAVEAGTGAALPQTWAAVAGMQVVAAARTGADSRARIPVPAVVMLAGRVAAMPAPAAAMRTATRATRVKAATGEVRPAVRMAVRSPRK